MSKATIKKLYPAHAGETVTVTVRAEHGEFLDTWSANVPVEWNASVDSGDALTIEPMVTHDGRIVTLSEALQSTGFAPNLFTHRRGFVQ